MQGSVEVRGASKAQPTAAPGRRKRPQGSRKVTGATLRRKSRPQGRQDRKSGWRIGATRKGQPEPKAGSEEPAPAREPATKSQLEESEPARERAPKRRRPRKSTRKGGRRRSVRVGPEVTRKGGMRKPTAGTSLRRGGRSTIPGSWPFGAGELGVKQGSRKAPCGA
jgi:hypothetical protein